MRIRQEPSAWWAKPVVDGDVAQRVGGAAGWAHGRSPQVRAAALWRSAPLAQECAQARRSAGSVDLGIIGAGIMGERLARAALEHATESVRLVAPSGTRTRRAMARIGRRCQPCAPLGSAEGASRHRIVFMSPPPPSSHLEHAAGQPAAGKALFCEKPLAWMSRPVRRFRGESGWGTSGDEFPLRLLPGRGAAARMDARHRHAQKPGDRTGLRLSGRAAGKATRRGWLDGPVQGGFTREVGSHFLFLARRLLGPLRAARRAGRIRRRGAASGQSRRISRRASLQARLTGGVGITDKDDHNLWTLTDESGAIRLRDWSVAERAGRRELAARSGRDAPIHACGLWC